MVVEEEDMVLDATQMKIETSKNEYVLPVKMGWRDWSYWLRGGIIAVGSYAVLVLLFLPLGWSGGHPALPIWTILVLSIGYLILILSPLIGFLLASIVTFLIGAIVYFILGTIVGLMVGKIKFRKQEQRPVWER